MHETHRILVVDDEPILTRLLGKVLRLEGYSTLLVNEAPAVLGHLRRFRPDAVVLDIAMPQMNGYEVAQQIRAEPGFEGMLIIAVSGFGDSSSAKRSLRSGIDHHLAKPVDMDALRLLLANELAKRKIPSPPPAPAKLEERRTLVNRLAEVNARIDKILESPDQRVPGEWGALIHERSQLEKELDAWE